MEFNSITDFKRNFTHVFHRDVVPSLQPFEQKRKSLVNTLMMTAVIAGMAIFCLIISQLASDIKTLFCIIIFCGYFVFLSLLQKNFERNLKSNILPLLLKAFGNLSWSQVPVIYPEEIKDSEIFSRWDYHNSDDNFYGTYKNSSLKISEVELYYYTRDSKGRRTKHTEFNGAIISIDVGKKFTGHTIVRRRTLILNKKVYDEVKLEDPEFSKQFFVDSNDQVESRYLLTTAFMERFKGIKNAFGAKHAECSFKDKKIMIALSTNHDLFSLGSLFKPVSDTTQFTIFLNEIVSIYEMIDYLKVTEKTGL